MSREPTSSPRGTAKPDPPQDPMQRKQPYSHNSDCHMSDPKCAACRENGVVAEPKGGVVKHAVMVSGRPQHKLGCDEMHAHHAPACCSRDCWCHDLKPGPDKIKLRCGPLMQPPFSLEVGDQPIDTGVEAVEVKMQAGELHRVVVTFNALEIDIEIKGRA